MKKVRVFSIYLAFLFLAAAPAFAETDVVVPDNAPWWAKVLAPALAPLILGLTALLAWLSKNVKTFVAQKASEANTAESAAWYKTALFLAGMAVRFAESKFGADTGTGVKKQAEASAWLKARLMSIDPSIVVKTPNLDQLIEGLVGAAYHSVFEAVSPLAGAPAPAKP